MCLEKCKIKNENREFIILYKNFTSELKNTLYCVHEYLQKKLMSILKGSCLEVSFKRFSILTFQNRE